jgi:hypothetical protein
VDILDRGLGLFHPGAGSGWHGLYRVTPAV